MSTQAGFQLIYETGNEVQSIATRMDPMIVINSSCKCLAL